MLGFVQCLDKSYAKAIAETREILQELEPSVPVQLGCIFISNNYVDFEHTPGGIS